MSTCQAEAEPDFENPLSPEECLSEIVHIASRVDHPVGEFLHEAFWHWIQNQGRTWRGIAERAEIEEPPRKAADPELAGALRSLIDTAEHIKLDQWMRQQAASLEKLEKLEGWDQLSEEKQAEIREKTGRFLRSRKMAQTGRLGLEKAAAGMFPLAKAARMSGEVKRELQRRAAEILARSAAEADQIRSLIPAGRGALLEYAKKHNIPTGPEADAMLDQFERGGTL